MDDRRALQPLSGQENSGDYSERLKEKIRLQAEQLHEQSQELEELAAYRQRCEEMLRQFDPFLQLPLEGAASGGGRPRRQGSSQLSGCKHCQEYKHSCKQLLGRAEAAEDKAMKVHSANIELRTLLEKRDKELALAQLKAGKLSDNAKAYELAKLNAEEYAKQLEAKLISTDQGQALLREAKVRNRMVKVDRANSALHAITKSQEREIEGLQRGVLELRHALHTEAKRLGLDGANTVLEIAKLRERLAEASAREEKLLEDLSKTKKLLEEADSRETELLRQQADNEEKTLQVVKLSATAERLEKDNSALLEYVQEITDARDAREKEAARLALEIERLSGAKASIEAAQSAVAAKDTQLENVYQQLRDAREEIVRMRAAGLEDVATVESQFQVAKDRLQHELIARESEAGRLADDLRKEREKSRDLSARLETAQESARRDAESKFLAEKQAMKAKFDAKIVEIQQHAQQTLLESQKIQQQLQKDLEASRAREHQLQDDMQSLQDRKRLLEKRVQMLEDEVAEGSRATVHAMEMHEQLEASQAEANSLRDQLGAARDEARRNVEQANADAEDWKSRALQAQDRHAELKMAEEEALRRAMVAEGQVMGLRSMLESQQQEVARARMQLLSQIAESGSSPGTSREKALQDMVDTLHRRLQKTEADLAHWMSSQNVADELAQIKDLNNQKTKEILFLTNECEELREKVLSANERLRRIHDALLPLGIVYSSRNAETGAYVECITEKILACLDQALQASNRERALQRELELARCELSSTEYARASDNNLLDKIVHDICDVGFQCHRSTLAEDIGSILSQLTSGKASNSEIASAAASLSDQLASARLESLHAAEESKRAASELRQVIMELEAEKQHTDMRASQAEGKLEEREAKLQELEESLADTLRKVGDLEVERDELTGQLREWQRKYEEADMRATEAKGAMEATETEMKRMRRLLRPALAATTSAITPSGAPEQHADVPADRDALSGTHGGPSAKLQFGAARQGRTTNERYKQMVSDGMRIMGARNSSALGKSSYTGPQADSSLRRRLLSSFRRDSSDEDEEAGPAGATVPREGTSSSASTRLVAVSSGKEAGGVAGRSAAERLRQARRANSGNHDLKI